MRHEVLAHSEQDGFFIVDDQDLVLHAKHVVQLTCQKAGGTSHLG
jgi:hypothetical protein